MDHGPYTRFLRPLRWNFPLLKSRGREGNAQQRKGRARMWSCSSLSYFGSRSSTRNQRATNSPHAVWTRPRSHLEMASGRIVDTKERLFFFLDIHRWISPRTDRKGYRFWATVRSNCEILPSRERYNPLWPRPSETDGDANEWIYCKHASPPFQCAPRRKRRRFTSRAFPSSPFISAFKSWSDGWGPAGSFTGSVRCHAGGVTSPTAAATERGRRTAFGGLASERGALLFDHGCDRGFKFC